MHTKHHDIVRELAAKISIWFAHVADIINSDNCTIRNIKDRVCHHGSAALSIDSASNLFKKKGVLYDLLMSASEADVQNPSENEENRRGRHPGLWLL